MIKEIPLRYLLFIGIYYSFIIITFYYLVS